MLGLHAFGAVRVVVVVGRGGHLGAVPRAHDRADRLEDEDQGHHGHCEGQRDQRAQAHVDHRKSERDDDERPDELAELAQHQVVLAGSSRRRQQTDDERADRGQHVVREGPGQDRPELDVLAAERHEAENGCSNDGDEEDGAHCGRLGQDRGGTGSDGGHGKLLWKVQTVPFFPLV